MTSDNGNFRHEHPVSFSFRKTIKFYCIFLKGYIRWCSAIYIKSIKHWGKGGFCWKENHRPSIPCILAKWKQEYSICLL